MTQKSKLLTFEALVELESIQRSPCLSLYQPTHRHPPDNRQDPILFGKLLKVLECLLLQMYPDAEIRQYLIPYQEILHDKDFWWNTLDGLAVLGGQNVFQVFRLQRPVTELVIAADTFHTKPLHRLLQAGESPDRT
jgi:hypothetical protein